MQSIRPSISPVPSSQYVSLVLSSKFVAFAHCFSRASIFESALSDSNSAYRAMGGQSLSLSEMDTSSWPNAELTNTDITKRSADIKRILVSKKIEADNFRMSEPSRRLEPIIRHCQRNGPPSNDAIAM